MIVKFPDDCPFRRLDEMDEGCCTLPLGDSGDDCGVQRYVARAKPLVRSRIFRLKDEPDAGLLDIVTVLAHFSRGTPPQYSPEDQAKVDRFMEERASFHAAHEAIVAIPPACPLRTEPQTFGQEPVTLEWVDGEYVEHPEYPSVTPLEKSEPGTPMMGLQHHLEDI